MLQVYSGELSAVGTGCVISLGRGVTTGIFFNVLMLGRGAAARAVHHSRTFLILGVEALVTATIGEIDRGARPRVSGILIGVPASRWSATCGGVQVLMPLDSRLCSGGTAC